MVDQSKSEKILNLIVNPMQEFYRLKSVPEAVKDAFIEDLGHFDEQTLAAAWKQVRRECKDPPKLAHFVEACEANRPRPTQSTPTSRKGYHQHNHALAEQVIQSGIGQLALREGVGYDLWMRAYRDGESEFTDRDVRRSRRSQSEAIDALAAYPSKDGPMYRALERMHETMVKREATLAAKYAA
jgi:hypothetical protein